MLKLLIPTATNDNVAEDLLFIQKCVIAHSHLALVPCVKFHTYTKEAASETISIMHQLWVPLGSVGTQIAAGMQRRVSV